MGKATQQCSLLLRETTKPMNINAEKEGKFTKLYESREPGYDTI
jgi:hypothetical protein